MRGVLPGLLTVAGRGCAAALALALVLHGSTKRPPVRHSAALDLGPLLSAWGESVSCRLDANGLPWDDMFEWTLVDVPRSRSGSIWTEDVRTSGGGILRDAALRGMPAGGTDIPRSELSALPEESRLLVLRARGEDASLRIRVLDADGSVLLSYAPPMVVLRAHRLYDWTNVRRLLGGRESCPSSLGDLLPEPGKPTLVFLHGFSVSEDDARAWGDALFKRLRLAGSRARFHCVAWRGDQGGSANYQENVANASAGHLAAELKRIPGRIVLMAHSLGNVVASSMVQDHGLGIGAYLMLDAAVPAEAYDTSAALRVPQLVHPDWDGYPTNSWAASWHRLFMGIPGDGRSLLGWPGRFAAVALLAVNFYSTGDEVLEIYRRNDIGFLTGVSDGLSHYAWHKQEMFKGRGVFNGMGATTWSGWNIDENFLGINRISAKEAQRMSDADFRTNTVFVCTPKSILDPKIDRAGSDAHLAMGIPALTPAAGTVKFGDGNKKDDMINLNSESPDGIARPNGWPERGTYSGRCFVEDVRGGCRIEECVPAVGAQVRRLDVRIVTDGDNGIREAVFTCEGQPVFRELDDLSFLFGREWNLLRVTHRGVGASDDWVTCSVRDRSLVLRIR